MTRRTLLLWLGVLTIGAWSAGPLLAKKPRDQVVGARWQYVAEKDGEEVTGWFRAYKKDLFIEDKKVGSIYPKDEDESKLTFTGLPDERLKGSVTIRKTVKGKNTTWVGRFKTREHGEWKFTARIRQI